MKSIQISFKLLMTITMLMVTAHTLYAQGINFETGLNWQQIKTKAKAENKYILVDCYATWCAPCKQMDKNVYSIDSIGRFANKNYVPIKVQFDHTSHDDANVKNWYADAESLAINYQVETFPTYLFFSPDGKLIHRSVGSKDPSLFMGILKRSLEPEHQYYTLLEAYHSGQYPISKLNYLAGLAKSIDDKESTNISETYINNYLLKLPNDSLFTQDHIQFMRDFLVNSNDNAFHFFYEHQAAVNKVMNDDHYAQSSICQIIEKEEILPILKKYKLKSNGLPKWNLVYQKMKTRYNNYYADFMVLCAKIKLAEIQQNWSNYCTYLILRVNKYGPYNKLFFYEGGNIQTQFNASAWELFSKSYSQKELKIALKWSKQTIDNNSQDLWWSSEYWDTYANILYKLGYVDMAMQAEQTAIQKDTKGYHTADFKNALLKIRNHQPTWPETLKN